MNRHPALRTALNLAVSVVAATAAQAAVAAISIDLHLGSDKVITADSLQFSVSNNTSSQIGGSEHRAGPPTLSDITWSQRMTTAYPLLLQRALTGQTIDEAKIELRSPGNAEKPAYLSLTTSNSMLTGASFANDSVAASMNYKKITMAYDPAGLNKTGHPVVIGYDSKDSTMFGVSSRAPTSYAGSRPASSGETEIYLRIDTIAGEANAIGYENWIKLDSAQMGAGILEPTAAGGSPGSTPKPTVTDITLSHAFDAATPALFGAAIKGNTIAAATIEYVTVGGAGPVTFMQLALREVALTALSLSTASDLPTVSESLSFQSFTQTVWEIDSRGKRGKATSFGYDVQAGKGIEGSLAANVPGFGAGNLTGELTVSAAGSDSGPLGAPVPEPGTWLMMLAGLGVLTAAGRRRATA